MTISMRNMIWFATWIFGYGFSGNYIAVQRLNFPNLSRSFASLLHTWLIDHGVCKDCLLKSKMPKFCAPMDHWFRPKVTPARIPAPRDWLSPRFNVERSAGIGAAWRALWGVRWGQSWLCYSRTASKPSFQWVLSWLSRAAYTTEKDWKMAWTETFLEMSGWVACLNLVFFPSCTSILVWWAPESGHVASAYSSSGRTCLPCDFTLLALKLACWFQLHVILLYLGMLPASMMH